MLVILVKWLKFCQKPKNQKFWLCPKKTKTKKLEFAKTIDKVFGIDFFIFKAKTALLHLQIAFTKALILYYFDSESYI